MVDENLKFTNLTFGIHFLVGLIFSIMFWLPEFTGPAFGLTYDSGTGALSMLLAAVFSGLTLSSILAFFAKEWKEVKILTITEIIWLIAGIIAMIVNLSAFNNMIYVSLAINIVMLILFALAFVQQEDKMKPCCPKCNSSN